MYSGIVTFCPLRTFSSVRSTGRISPTAFLRSFLFGMPIGFIERHCRFAQIMILAQLMWHIQQGRTNRIADRMLLIRDNPSNRDRQEGLDFPYHLDEFFFGFAQKGASSQDFSRKTVAQHPQHFMPHIRFSSLEPGRHTSLFGQSLLKCCRK